MKKKLLITLLVSFVGLYACEQSPTQLNAEAKALWQKEDFKNAVPLYLKSAKQGSAEAQFIIGICYKHGREMVKNDSIANTWFLKSAQQGYEEAQEMMMLITSSRKEESFFWTKKCAENNNPLCMLATASAYEKGEGTVKNIDSMIIWRKRAALLDTRDLIELKGHSIANARLILAEMYRDGNYVTKDLVESFSWFLIYNECKRKLWHTVQENNIKAIQEVEKLLSEKQKDNAREKAELILQRPLKELSNLHNTAF